MSRPLAIELFAGCGAMAHRGLERTHDVQLAVEYDTDCVQSAVQRSGLDPERFLHADVRDPVVRQRLVALPRVHLLWSSTPCQPWSQAGSRDAADDPRNGWPWLFAVLRYLTRAGKLPTWTLCENVPGMVSHARKAHPEWKRSKRRPEPETAAPRRCPRCYWDHVVLPSLRALYPCVSWTILDAADHGTPQNRRRVILWAGPAPVGGEVVQTHSQEALVAAKWGAGSAGPLYWWEHGIVPHGVLATPVWAEPSAAELRVLEVLRGERGSEREQEEARARAGLVRWCTVRDVLGLDGRLGGMRNSVNNPRQERPASTDEPAPTVGTRRNQVLEARETPVGLIDPGAGQGKLCQSHRVVGGGHNPNHAADAVRRLRDLTDTPSTTIAAHHGGSAGNAGPFVIAPTGGAYGLDRPSVTVTGQEVKGTRGKHLDKALVNKGQARSGGPDRASDQVWLATGRRRLEVYECALLMGIEPDDPNDLTTADPTPGEHPRGHELYQTKSSRYRQVGNGCPEQLTAAAVAAVLRAERTKESVC